MKKEKLLTISEASELLEIITVFSARLYGSRSHKNKKLIDGMKKVVDDSFIANPKPLRKWINSR